MSSSIRHFILVTVLAPLVATAARAIDDTTPTQSSAPAQGAASEAPANPRFDRLDADGDGRISRTEYLGSIRDKKRWWQLGKRTANTDQNSATPTMFAALDRDADGYLTQEELNSGQRLQESRGDNGEGASRTRNVHPPGDPKSSQKTESETAADKQAKQTK